MGSNCHGLAIIDAKSWIVYRVDFYNLFIIVISLIRSVMLSVRLIVSVRLNKFCPKQNQRRQNLVIVIVCKSHSSLSHFLISQRSQRYLLVFFLWNLVRKFVERIDSVSKQKRIQMLLAVSSSRIKSVDFDLMIFAKLSTARTDSVQWWSYRRRRNKLLVINMKRVLAKDIITTNIRTKYIVKKCITNIQTQIKYYFS